MALAPRHTVSVVITNYNYGHFVRASVESVRRQTVAVDQLVIVDDGSTDASRDILGSLGDADIVLQDNKGQAAAFNAGFAEATGDIVIFLDADDQLCPHAIETIKRLWHPSLALMSYDLTMIDGAGEEVGLYPISVPSRDMRTQIRKRLLFPFMPTSGNAVSREAVDWAFPLPEARWKISADALLVRAAMLSGPSIHQPHALGRYAVHGQNNYYTEGMARQTSIRRALLDIADAGLDLIELADARKTPLTSKTVEDLSEAALDVAMRAEGLGGDGSWVVQFLKRAARIMPPRFARRALGCRALRGLGKGKSLTRWVLNPAEAPRGANLLLSGFRAGQADGTREDPVDRDVMVRQKTRLDLMTHLVGPGWKFGPYGETAILVSNRAWFCLRRLADRACEVTLKIGGAAPETTLLVTHGDTVIAHCDVSDGTDITLALPAPDPLCPIEERLRFDVSGPSGLKAAKVGAGRFTIENIEIEPATRPTPAHVLPVSDIKSAGLAPLVVAGGGTLSLARSPVRSECGLQIVLGPEQIPGLLSLSHGGVRLFDGWVGAGKTVQAQVLFVEDSAPLTLDLGFIPEDATETAEVQVAGFGWLPGDALAQGGPPVLAPGCGYPSTVSEIYGEGWSVVDGQGGFLFGTSALLHFAVPALRAEDEPVLKLDIELLDPPIGDEDFALVVSYGDQTLAQAKLRGRGVFEVPLPRSSGPVALNLTASPIPIRRHSGLRLHTIRLSGIGPAASPPPAGISPDRLGSSLEGLVRKVRADGQEQDVTALRDEAVHLIEGLSDKAAMGLSPEILGLFMGLGARCPGRDVSDPPPSDAIAGPWLRWFATAMLSGPAWHSMSGLALSDYPVGQADYAVTFGLYLAETPRLVDARSAKSFAAWLTKRHEEAQEILATRSMSGWHAVLAKVFVRECRPIALYFHDIQCRETVAAVSQSIETLLLREGHDLIGTEIVGRGASSGPVTRLAVTLRNDKPTPEAWILKAMLARLDRSVFDVTIYFLEHTSPFSTLFAGEKVVALGGVPLNASVAEIRKARPDVALLGAVHLGSSKVAHVAAHRLAPRQFAMSAVFPMTTGFRSVDQFAVGALTTPKIAEGDYVEEVVHAPGTGQVFAFDGAVETDEAEVALWRARLGIAEDAVVLTSGAMHDKIVPELLSAWVTILAKDLRAVLVLYPFARNWAEDFDTRAFLDRVHLACEAEDVDPGRIHVLSPIEHDKVLGLLSQADLYLDSFPYSGATTVVEALSLGVPVVSRHGNSQRCHQGSGWLEACGVGACSAKDTSEYIKITCGFIANPAERAALREKIQAGREAAFAQDAFSAWLPGFLAKGPAEVAPRYVFNHMPKAGGTSTRRVFRKWFAITPNYREPWSPTPPETLDLSTIAPNGMLAGHFSADMLPLNTTYPETLDPTRWRRIAFIREPLDLALSIYFFEKKRRTKFDPSFELKPLGQFLREYEGLYLRHFECDEDTWRAALGGYWFVGTLERLDECLAWLASSLDKPLPDEVPVLNVTTRSETADPEDIKVFLKNNRVEFDIYREVSARLAAKLGEPALDRL